MRGVLLLSIIAIGLTACGIRPKTLPPEGMGKENDPFPRTYPDLSTDPQ